MLDLPMFSFFKKDPLAKLNKQYYQKLESAMLAQRAGDIKSYSSLTAEEFQKLRSSVLFEQRNLTHAYKPEKKVLNINFKNYS